MDVGIVQKRVSENLEGVSIKNCFWAFWHPRSPSPFTFPSSLNQMNCTLLIHSRKLAVKGEQPPTQDELCKNLESKDDGVKIAAAKQTILLLLNGEKLPRLTMTVIRFCINTKDKMLKKLIMLYWEVVEKFDSEGKLKPEMILVW